jgi:UDP-N-acetyl-D-mannosaminuronic acid dehydrogenase
MIFKKPQVPLNNPGRGDQKKMVESIIENWKVSKIAVVGPGIVGMPMAALLANARVRIGTDTPAKVVVVQRNSPTSGWKVAAINSGRSVIGGIEPDLDRIVNETVQEGILCASHDYSDLADADVILVCIQTDKNGLGPDYGPMFEGLHGIARALQNKPAGKVPLIVFESTLAPSSMMTLIKEHFIEYNLLEGRDILLGNSPNRVMPGRLVERVADSDKLIGGLSPITPKLIERLYRHIVTKGKLHLTNSLTAEIVKTLENAYRDVRIAYTTEVVRYCDAHDIDFYRLRDEVNNQLSQQDQATTDPNAVPCGGLLIPTIGVGGHCLPKDGILMLWRMLEQDPENPSSLILESRKINDESPADTIRQAEKQFGSLDGKTVALMGTAYRFNSEDTRNSPTLPLAKLLLGKGCRVMMHDPYVKPGDQKLKLFNLQECFTRDAGRALENAEVAIFCTAHRDYIQQRHAMLQMAPRLIGVFDGCNLFQNKNFNGTAYAGIGRGNQPPSEEFVKFVRTGFQIMEGGVANELNAFIEFANNKYAKDDFNRAVFKDVQRIAGTCVTGCDIADHGAVEALPAYAGFLPRLVQCAQREWAAKNG